MQSNKPRMDTMLPWIPFCSKRKRHFINSPYNMLRSHTSNPTFILVHSWSTIMKPSLSLVLQTPLMNVCITKNRILSNEAYPEERSHGQSLDELKARFGIGNLHHQPYSLRWWRQWCNRDAQALHMKARFDIGNLHRVKTHVWQVVRLVIYHTIFITRYRETGRVLKNQGCGFVEGASRSITELIWLSFGNGSK